MDRTSPSGRSRYDDLARLVDTAVPVRHPGALARLERICLAAVARVGVDGAAVDLMSETGSGGVSAASGARAHRRAELQFAAGEGPCQDAYVARRPVLVPDLERATARWPGYAGAAQEAGLRAVFAFPLVVGAAGFGVLELVRDRPGSLDDEQVADALTFAQMTTDHLMTSTLTTTEGELVPEMATAVEYRAEIYQAQGMLTVSLGLSLVEALVLMRSYAFSHDLTLIAVAQAVRNGSLLTDDSAGGTPHA